MCRYAMVAYKSHYACFRCRKSFKRRLLKDVTGNAKFQEKEARCPDCGTLMASMGKDFEAPARNKVKAWQHIQDLYKVGIAFHSCGCAGSGYVPADKEQLIAYLQEKLEDYQHQLKFWRDRKEPSTQSEADREHSKNSMFFIRIWEIRKRGQKIFPNEDAKNYWMEKIRNVEQDLALIKSSSK